MTTALKLLAGEGSPPAERVEFTVRRHSRKGKPLPAGTYLVTTARVRPPYALDLTLYVNPQ